MGRPNSKEVAFKIKKGHPVSEVGKYAESLKPPWGRVSKVVYQKGGKEYGNVFKFP